MWFKPDPGPCPVDDAPHTTCVGPSPQGNTAPPRPPRDGPRAPRSVRVLFGRATGALTTATYGRTPAGRPLRDKR